MAKEVIKAKIVDKIWGDMAEDRVFEGRHLISDEDWSSIRLYLEIAYEAGYKEGLDQAAESQEWYKGFDDNTDEPPEGPDLKKKP